MRKFSLTLLTLGVFLIFMAGNLKSQTDCMHQGRMASWHPRCNIIFQECEAVLNFNCYVLSYQFCTGKDGFLYMIPSVKQTPCPQPSLTRKKFEIPKGWKYLNRKEKAEKRREKK